MSLFDRLANSLGLDDFSQRHKIAFIALAVALIAVVWLWSSQLRKNINDPLYKQVVSDSSADQQTNAYGQSEAELKAKDTDGDGLSDWDELNLYKTSPYLADSDSDGFNDKQEIDSNNDPNCPQGQTCTSASTGTSAAPSQISDIQNPELLNMLNNAPSTTVSPTASGSASASSQLTAEEKQAFVKALGENPSAATLRQYLLQAGMDKKTLDALSDAQLLQSFAELSK